MSFWIGADKIVSHKYTCSFCGSHISSQIGYRAGKTEFTAHSSKQVTVARIYICHVCDIPSIFIGDQQFPGVKFGNYVKHIPDEAVSKLYDEARSCYSVNAFTSVVICCRKLLMNFAVSEGAIEGESFVEYVNFLESKNFIPPRGKEWVDSIRKMGNEANHSIDFKSHEDARLILTFTEMLLKINYEMPGLLAGPDKK